MVEMLNMVNTYAGHRQRLRQRFLASGAPGLPEAELLELLLTYAIPRQDVAPLAHRLLERFGSLPDVLAASHKELLDVHGIGEQAAVLIRVAAQLANRAQAQREPAADVVEHPALLEIEPELGSLFDQTREPEKFQMRTFTNDLSAAALEYLPQIVNFGDIGEFQVFLEQNLPYNSLTSRKRYARNLISRYYPNESVHTLLTTFLSYKPALDTLRPVLFYETARAEPTVQLVAEDVIWPAVPVGHVNRARLRERLEAIFPQVSKATIRRMLYSLFNVYTTLNDARANEEVLRFQIHRGTFEAFLYVLTAEFPQPGMYRFEELEEGPMRHWLLWDREWMHQQLYNLRDLGILSKVSQIDTLRQFTLPYDRRTALCRYFEHPERGNLALREQPEGGSEV